MKKFTTLLFLLLFGLGYSQPPTIINFYPDTVCPGDSICAVVYNPSHEDFYFIIQTKWEWNWYTVKADPDLPTIYSYCFLIPLSQEQGPGFIGLTTNVVYPVFFLCEDVGIRREWDENEPGESRYYDLMGNEVLFRYGEVLIERRGRYARMVRVD